MKRARAYLLPSNIEPENDFCAKVFIPDADEYRRAFLGAYIFFGKWIAWEKDGTDKAARAAARWRDSIEETLMLWGDGCECDEMTEEEKQELIEEIIEAMTITINNNVNCGCGCDGSTSSSDTYEEEDYFPPDYEVPTIEPVEPADYVQPTVKCDRANFMMVAFRNMCLNVMQNLTVYQVFSDFWELTTGALWSGYPPAYDFFLRIKTWAENKVFTSQFLSAYDNNHDAMVCALFSAETAVAGKSAVSAILEEFVYPNVSPLLAMAYRDIWENMPISNVYDVAAVVDLPPGFDGRECCGSVPQDTNVSTWSYVSGTTGIETSYVNDCGSTLTNVAEEWNIPIKYKGEATLVKESQYGAYEFDLSRTATMGDATYFNLTLKQTGALQDVKLILYDGQGANIYELEQVPAAEIVWNLTSADVDFSSVGSIRLQRDEDIYNAACPRLFGWEVDVDTDSVDWLNY